jgi:hypothetical protein
VSHTPRFSAANVLNLCGLTLSSGRRLREAPVHGAPTRRSLLCQPVVKEGPALRREASTELPSTPLRLPLFIVSAVRSTKAGRNQQRIGAAGLSGQYGDREAMSSILSKKWAIKAQELELGQLEAFRTTAEKWRNGLGGLAALVGTATVIKGPDVVTALGPLARPITIFSIAISLIALVTGSLFAMNAAFGLPGRVLVLSGENLRRWERKEIRSGHQALGYAKLSFLIAVAGIATGTFVGLLYAEANPGVVAITDTAGEVVCGTLSSGNAEGLTVKDSKLDQERLIPYADVEVVRLIETCPD